MKVHNPDWILNQNVQLFNQIEKQHIEVKGWPVSCSPCSQQSSRQGLKLLWEPPLSSSRWRTSRRQRERHAGGGRGRRLCDLEQAEGSRWRHLHLHSQRRPFPRPADRPAPRCPWVPDDSPRPSDLEVPQVVFQLPPLLLSCLVWFCFVFRATRPFSLRGEAHSQGQVTSDPELPLHQILSPGCSGLCSNRFCLLLSSHLKTLCQKHEISGNL